MFDQVLILDVNFHQLNLTRGSSCLLFPDWISSKKAIINPQNEEDEGCFKWAVLTALHHESTNLHLERMTNLRRFEGGYDWRGLGFPLPLNNIDVFKWNNNISVNVLATGGGKENLYILRKAKFNDQRKTTNLLLIAREGKRHYLTIKNLSQLLASSNSEH